MGIDAQKLREVENVKRQREEKEWYDTVGRMSEDPLMGSRVQEVQSRKYRVD